MLKIDLFHSIKVILTRTLLYLDEYNFSLIEKTNNIHQQMNALLYSTLLYRTQCIAHNFVMI